MRLRASTIAAVLPLLAAAAAPSVARAQSVAAGAPAAALVVHDGVSPPAAAWRAAMEAGDLAALARMHDDGTTAFPPDRAEEHGTAAIMAGYAALFARNTVEVAFDEAHWAEAPPLVVSWGRTTLTLHPKAGGAASVTHTRFTDAATAVGGGWRYLVDHASVPTP